jgi:hypothetical protein
MKARLRFALFISLTTLLGCSVSPHSAYSPPSLTGNWQASTIMVTHTIGGFVGALQSSGGSVSGTLTPQISLSFNNIVQFPCATLAPTAVTGSIDANNNLTLSLPLGGGIANITAIVGSNLETAAAGSFEIVGGTCATPATPMSITEYAAVTGTYTGSFTNMQDGTASPVTAALTQSTIPNSDGVFPLTGTITLTGQCNTSFVIDSSHSYVEGDVVSAMSGAPNPISPYSLLGYNASNASTISSAGLYQANQKGCIEYEGTLTRQ